MNKRFYYKTKDGTGLLSLKTPLLDLTNYIAITEEEYNELKPKEEDLRELLKREVKDHE